MLSADLCIPRLSARTSDDVIRALAARLLSAGCVRPSFERAAVERERRSPTGLPFPGVAAALPHADPEHVILPAIAMATLATSVSFRQMGTPSVKIDVSLVVMPALTAREQAAGELSRLIALLQDEHVRRALVGAETSQRLYEALALKLGP